jgi:hypothetical protein
MAAAIILACRCHSYGRRSSVAVRQAVAACWSTSLRFSNFQGLGRAFRCWSAGTGFSGIGTWSAPGVAVMSKSKAAGCCRRRPRVRAAVSLVPGGAVFKSKIWPRAHEQRATAAALSLSQTPSSSYAPRSAQQENSSTPSSLAVNISDVPFSAARRQYQ